MPDWSAVLLIIVAGGWLGELLRRQFGTFEGDWLEVVFVNLSLGILTMGWVALLLAELGWFSIGRLAVIWLILVSTLTLVTRQKSRIAGEQQPVVAAFLLAFWLIAAVWLFFRPHQYITGAADAGVYVNLGASIAQDGRLLIHNDLLADLDPALYSALLRPIPRYAVAPYYLVPAFFVIGEPRGQVTPQFYPLHPVWQAVAHSMAGTPVNGVRAELLLTGLWALLGTLAVYLTVRQLAGWATAMLALGGLTINALQVWFARYPTTESLSQYLLWAGLWSLAVWLSGRRPQPLWALLAGLCLGQQFLARIDTLFILPILVGLVVWLWAHGWETASTHRAEPLGEAWFVGSLGFMITHSLIHGYWQSRPYFYELFGYGLALLRLYWIVPVAGSVAGVMMLGFIGRFRGRFHLLARYRQPVLLALILLLLLLAGYAWFIRPYAGVPTARTDAYTVLPVPNTNHENLVRLGWYLSPVGIWLGVAGIALLLWRVNRQTAVLLAITLFFSLFYLWDLRANTHHIYVMRRYVAATLPLLILGAAYLLGWLLAQPRMWLKGLAAVGTVIWLGGLAWSARGFISQVDYPNMVNQLDEFNNHLEPGAVLIFNDPAPVGLGDFFGTPLMFLYGHPVFTLRDLAALDEPLFAQTVKSWQNNGRSVYWIGDPGWLPAHGFSYSEVNYTLSSSYLENSYDHKPGAILSAEWVLRVARVE